MSPDELAARLRACLAETLPGEEERAALAAGLRELAEPEAELAEPLSAAAAEIAGAKERRSLAVAAARTMRLLSAYAAAQAEQAPEEPEPTPGEKRRARRAAAAERRQAKALDDARAKPLDPSRRPVETLRGIGRVAGLALRARGLHTVGDLAWLLPLGYQDERSVTPIGALVIGERQLSEGVVVSARSGPRGRGRRMAEVVLEAPDGSGERLRLTWFNVPRGLTARFATGARFRVAGMVDEFRGVKSITHPQTDRIDQGQGAAAAGVRPRYPVVPGVPPRALAKAVAAAVAACAKGLPDAIPQWQRQAHGLSLVGEALAALHDPPAELGDEELERWNTLTSAHHERLAFEEFFLLELALHRRRVEEQGVAAEPLEPVGAAVDRARAALGFELTAAQARVAGEIADDMRGERPMRRLLQGDVGSGKTAVALLAAAQAVAAGGQVAFMAPTEILAEQHFRSLAPVAEAMGLRASLVLGGARASHRRKTRKALAEGRIDLAVGTHALLSEGVEFARLRLVVVDEQHRFGVGQRLRLVDKAGGVSPHLLVMTATPIPRTLALALHGDLSASVLDEMPPGRVPPVTRAYTSGQRDRALHQLERGLESGGQGYVVCPTIEPNEETGLRSALEAYEDLSERFGEWGVGLLHGQLSAEDKQAAMERFKSGERKLLVSTTIVEVGVDVPSANVMLIEHCERFGLAQLHQLRGRVGRAGQRSACLLVHEAKGEEAQQRIKVMCESADGFLIAEEDLKLRGPGELFGRRQSGLPGFRFGDLRRDAPLLARARELAQELIERDPELEEEVHSGARRALEGLAESDRAIVKEEAG